MPLSYLTDTYNGFERGSYLFTEEQRASFRLIVDVEIVSRVGLSSFNYRYPNPQTFYGYGQIFYGTSNFLDIPLEYGRQRVLDVINWQTLISQLDRRQNLWFNQMFAWLATSSIEPEGIAPEIPESFEVFSIRETQIKINTEFKSAFKIIVTWLPLNLLVPYGELQDSDSSDPTDGQPEYPEPTSQPSESPIPEGFDRSPPNPDSDPRDYPDDSNNLGNWGTIVSGLIEAWGGSGFITLGFNISLAGYQRNVVVDASNDEVPGGIYNGKQTYFGYTATLENGTVFGPLETGAGYTKGSAVVINYQYIPPE